MPTTHADLFQPSRTFIADALTTAVEGGVNYWAVTCDMVRDADRRVTSVAVRDGEDDNAEWITVDIEAATHAVHCILASEGEIAPHLRRELAMAVLEDDAGRIDATLADCIVQIAVYGDIVFG